MDHVSLSGSTPVTQSIDRKKFVITAAKIAGAITLLPLPFSGRAEGRDRPEWTIQQVIDIILKDIPGAPFPKTVDTVKSGNAANKVTGIVTCMFATVAVIREAIRLNANFIIAHEPTYYNHTDDIKWIEKNDIVAEKQQLLERNKITVWRFHDYWHTAKPDGVQYGVIKKAGWENYYKPGESLMTTPGSSLKDIAIHLKARLGIAHVRVIGDLAKICKTIVLLPGASGGQAQMRAAESKKPDLLIAGEVHEWETAEYIRDARLLGHNISLIILGHSVSEEPGMEWLVEWLQPKVAGMKITHVVSGDPFTWV